jgi:hypothetical protein
VAAALRLGFDVLSVDPETVFFRLRASPRPPLV